MIYYNNNLCAVILTGGQSLRMGGGIKSLKKFNNKYIFDRIFENLQTQVEKVIINSNDFNYLYLSKWGLYLMITVSQYENAH